AAPMRLSVGEDDRCRRYLAAEIPIVELDKLAHSVMAAVAPRRNCELFHICRREVVHGCPIGKSAGVSAPPRRGLVTLPLLSSLATAPSPTPPSPPFWALLALPRPQRATSDPIRLPNSTAAYWS